MALVGSFFVGAFIDPNVIAQFTRVLSPGVFFPIYKKRHLAKMDLRVAPSTATVFQMCPRPATHIGQVSSCWIMVFSPLSLLPPWLQRSIEQIESRTE